jgi:pyruvate formate lyase activating enzyme
VRKSRRETGSSAAPMRLWIRTPLIPLATATEHNIRAIGTFLRDNLLDVVERWELCAFNSACKTKYRRMGLDWSYEHLELMSRVAVDHLVRAALNTGIPSDRLVVSGLTAGAG